MATAEGELSDATINSYRYTMKRLDAVLADRMLNSVIAEDLEAALRTQVERPMRCIVAMPERLALVREGSSGLV